MKFEIKKVYALEEYGKWQRITYSSIGEFQTSAGNPKRAFLHALHKLGIFLHRGRDAVVDKEIGFEVMNRRTGRPLFVAIRVS